LNGALNENETKQVDAEGDGARLARRVDDVKIE
jgi:hypothetical protein